MVVPMQPIIDELGSLRRSIDSLEANKSDKGPEDVYVENLDEIKKHLRDELDRFGKSLKSILESAKLPSFNISETIKLSNIGDLEKGLVTMTKILKEFDGKVSKMNFEPNITVQASVPDIHIPEIKCPDIHVPEMKMPEMPCPQVHVNMQGVIEALEPLNLLSKDPAHPLAVRLSDGVEFLKELTTTMRQGNDQLAAVVSTSYGLTKEEYKSAFYDITSNVKGYTDTKALSNGDAVQMKSDSITIRYVDVTVTGGPVAIGFDNTVLATAGSEVGVMLYPANSPYRIHTDKINKLWVAGANGRRVCFNYFV